MNAKKPNANHRTRNLTVEADSPLKVFADRRRGKPSSGIVTSYDPELAALAEFWKRKYASDPASDKSQLADLARILEDCLRTAAAIKNKHGTELRKLLRDARRQVALIDSR